MWERWDGWDPIKGFQDPGMNSFNHYAFGAIAEWIYGYLSGIRWDHTEPGCKKVILNPRPDQRLQWATAGTQGVFSSWRYIEGKWKWIVETPVPALVIPPPGMSLLRGGAAVPDAGMEVSPGRHDFVSA